MKKDAWNPQQYDKFKNERSQPFSERSDPRVRLTAQVGSRAQRNEA